MTGHQGDKGSDRALSSWVRDCLGGEDQGLSLVPHEAPDYELPGWQIECTQQDGSSYRVKLVAHRWYAESPVCFHFVLNDPAWPKRGDMMLSSGDGGSPGLKLAPRPDDLADGPQDILLGGHRTPYRVVEYLTDGAGRVAVRIVIEATLPGGAGTVRRVFEADAEGGCRFLSLGPPVGRSTGETPDWFASLTSPEAMAALPWRQ